MTNPPHVVIVVLGDLGRSPRMQYHALALADRGALVSLVGLAGEGLTSEVGKHARIRVVSIPERIDAGDLGHGRVAYLARASARSALQFLELLFTLLVRISRPNYILAQNPPAIPTLPLVWLAARMRGAALVLDWHNLSHSLLSLKLPHEHPAVRAVASVEREIGRRADANLCVSHEMRKRLADSWQVRATTLHDRPSSAFRRLEPRERCALRSRLGLTVGDGRPTALVVTATSWTADEDLGVLVEAVVRLDDRIVAQRRLEPLRRIPPFLFLVTGKGPRRAEFETRIARLHLRHVEIRTAWFEWDDYQAVLGAADLGLSLHRSSSGIDLPMKVLDMFGAGLPVCAFDYGPCLDELIRPGENGMLFHSSGELATIVFELFSGYPDATPRLEHLRRGALAERRFGWQESWQHSAGGIFGLEAAPRPACGTAQSGSRSPRQHGVDDRFGPQAEP